VIASSGFDQLEHEALARGAAVFLKKPIDFARFLVVLEALLEGGAPAPEVLTQLGAQTLCARQRARAHRQELWTRLDPTSPKLQAQLDACVQRVGSYFAPVTALLTIVEEEQVHVLASSSSEIAAGTVMERGATFHADVVEGGSSLVLGNAAIHAGFADHPGARSGARFWASAPLAGNPGFPIGTLSLQDPQPRVFQAEDLLILEHVAFGMARSLEAVADASVVGPNAFGEPGVFTREALHVLLRAELGRTARSGGTVELALIGLDADAPALIRQAAKAAYGDAGGERFAVATVAPGVLALLRGAGDSAMVQQRIELALNELRRSGVVTRGVGIVTYRLAGSAALDETEIVHLAEEARVRALTLGSSTERILLAYQPA
jgi:uncharacterized protein YjeT (DUF2065 family)